jgi:5-methylcytosine-specific restriction endonuclease McrA
VKLTKKQKQINKRARHMASKTYQAKQVRTAYKKALKEWSLEVRQRDGKCFLCSRTDSLNAHHIICRFEFEENSLDPMIGIALCRFCHKYSPYGPHAGGGMVFNYKLKEGRPEQYQYCINIALKKWNQRGTSN